MTTKQGLLWEMDGDMLGHGNVGQEHVLFDQEARVSPFVRSAIRGQPVLVKIELQLQAPKADGAILKSVLPQDLRNGIEDLHIMLNARDLVVAADGDVAQALAIKNVLRVLVGQFGSRPVECE